MKERIYYRITPDSPVMAVIEEAQEKNRVFMRAAKELQVEFRGSRVRISEAWSQWVSGIQFEGEIPDGWRVRKGENFARPNKRTKAGRDAAERLKKLPHGVCAAAFTDMLEDAFKTAYTHHGEGHIAWTAYEKYGDVYVLSVPLGCNVTPPPGCIELKMSEYWSLREKAKESAA